MDALISSSCFGNASDLPWSSCSSKHSTMSTKTSVKSKTKTKTRGVLWWATATGMALFGVLLVLSFRVQYHSLNNTLSLADISATSTTSLSIAQAKEHFQVSLGWNSASNDTHQSNTSTHQEHPLPVAPWRNSTILPLWMKEYFAWHQQSLADIQANPSHWSNYKYLVYRCVSNDQKCGGAADRLKSLPLAMRIAHKLHRLIFYYWERPTSLTEFYQPPTDGLDWRWPPIPQLAHNTTLFVGPPQIFTAKDIDAILGLSSTDTTISSTLTNNLPQIISMRYRSHHHGSIQYNHLLLNSQSSEAPFEHVFRDLWQSVFAPSPAVQARIHAFCDQHPGMIHSNTVSAIHIRSKYIDQYTPTQVAALAHQAVDCLAKTRTTTSTDDRHKKDTIIVSSDDPAAAQMAMEYGKQRYQWINNMIALSSSNQSTLHLDRGQHFLASKAKHFDHTPHAADAYYDTFRDVALLAHTTGCLVMTHGNYAKWAHLLRPPQNKCLVDASTAACQQQSSPQKKNQDAPMVVNPPNDQKPNVVPSNSNAASTTTTRVAPWRTSQILPQWMKDYFAWHQEARHNITTGLNSWQDYDYLVYRCLEVDPICGGAADRLRPLPFVILLAQKLKRLVFYKWERPAALEEFLVPPVDGLDWRWPPHPDLTNHKFALKLTLDKFKAHHLMGIKQKDDFAWTPKQEYTFKAGPKIATYRFQSTSCGAPEFNTMRMNKTLEPSYYDVFADVWNSVFVPSPPVQALIDQHMNELHLQPDKYHAVHIRSQYHKELNAAFLRKLTQNAVNCLYQYLAVNRSQPLDATTPVFVASDNRDTLKRAMDYATSRGLQRVVALNPDQADKVTLHLDRGAQFLARNHKNFTRHEPSEYCDTFVDLYMLSQAQCITLNVGNFARWANFFSSDPSCEYSHMKDKSCTFPVGGVAPGK